MAGVLRVLVVDDHEMFSGALALLFALESGIDLVASVGAGEEAVTRCRDEAPDVLLMDVDLSGMDGIEATRLIRSASPPRALWCCGTSLRALGSLASTAVARWRELDDEDLPDPGQAGPRGRLGSRKAGSAETGRCRERRPAWDVLRHGPGLRPRTYSLSALGVPRAASRARTGFQASLRFELIVVGCPHEFTQFGDDRLPGGNDNSSI
jgi:CheY-like chemotaxis protein